MFKVINGTKTNINPTEVEQSTYQKHGLRPADRKPNDYLRMVARTFSSFRNTSSSETVVSYINGFEITHNDATVVSVVDWVPADIDYDLFKVNKGVCIIDNQLIDIFEDTIFYFDKSGIPMYPGTPNYPNFGGLLFNTKYGVIVEYDYIEQYAENTANVRIVPYNDLNFPLLGDANRCIYKDETLSGTLSSTENSGKPSLLIGTFFVDELGNIIQSLKTPTGVSIPGIDPQFLSHLYMQNYKLLFEYFGVQASKVFSAAKLTQATFMNINVEKIAHDLKSGDMCYYNPEYVHLNYTDINGNPLVGAYCKSIASRQKFNQVVGLYLNEFAEGNHLIYMNGIVTIDKTLHNLPDDHTLLNMTTGRHYFLEDECSLFDTTHPTMTVDNYILTDSSGRISLRFYPGAVRVGYSSACNQIHLNIDHSLEIATGNLLGLFGNAEEYRTEYLANSGSISAAAAIAFSNNRIEELYTKIDTITGIIGVDKYSEMLTWATALNSEKFNYLLYQIILLYFGFGTNNKMVTLLPVIPTSVLDQFTSVQKTDITSGISKYNKLKNISNLIKINIAQINQLLIVKNNLTIYYGDVASTNALSVINNKLKIARLLLQDNPSVMENFEDKSIDVSTDTTSYDYSKLITDTNLINTNLINASIDKIDAYKDLLNQIHELETMVNTLNIYLSDIETLILTNNNIIAESHLEIATLEEQILEQVIFKSQNDAKIISTPNLRLDIFLMDEHQRQVFNYTYITDRLRRRLYLVDVMIDDLAKAELVLETRLGSAESTIIEKIAAQQEVVRMQNLIKVNNDLISNYTTEYNKIRKDTFALPPVVKGDVTFDEAGISDQRIGTYRYGCDPDDVYNGLASNTFSPFITKSYIRVNKYLTLINKYMAPEITGSVGGIVGDITIELNKVITTVPVTIDANGDSVWSFTGTPLPVGNYIVKIIGIDTDGLEFIKIEAFKVELPI